MKTTYQVRCQCDKVNASQTGRITHCEECGDHISNQWKHMSTLREIDKATKARALSNLFDFFEAHNFCYDYYDGVAEPGYDDKPMICANWNDREGQPNWSKIADWISEYFDFSIEWSDEWSSCVECNKAVRTSPDSYGWEKSFVWFECGDLVCSECINKDTSLQADVVEELKNRTDKAASSWFYTHMENMGFVCYSPDEYCKTYANGWYPGQADYPKEIAENIEKELPDHDYMFKIDGVGQFDVHFSVYLRKKME